MESSCEHCEENEAEHFCVDCALRYCKTCSEFLHRKVILLSFRPNINYTVLGSTIDIKYATILFYGKLRDHSLSIWENITKKISCEWCSEENADYKCHECDLGWYWK